MSTQNIPPPTPNHPHAPIKNINSPPSTQEIPSPTRKKRSPNPTHPKRVLNACRGELSF